LPSFRIDREQNRAAETVMLAQDLRQRGQSFLGAILFIAGKKHNVLSPPWPFAAGVLDPMLVIGAHGCCRVNDESR
jgi:hypothetical protein